MATYAVTYAYSDGSAEARDEHRPRHVDFLKAEFDAGRLVKSGPFGPDGAPGALLLFAAGSKAEVEALLDQDPFHREGLIQERTVRQWNIFFGADSGKPAPAAATAPTAN